MEEESRWEEIGSQCIGWYIGRPDGRSTSDASHHRDTLMQRARKCRPRCPLCVSATTISTRFSNFASPSYFFDRYETDSIVPTVRRATGKSCPSIGRPTVEIRRCLSFARHSLFSSYVYACFDRSVVLDGGGACSLWFHRYIGFTGSSLVFTALDFLDFLF